MSEKWESGCQPDNGGEVEETKKIVPAPPPPLPLEDVAGRPIKLPKTRSAIGRPDNAQPKMLSEKDRIENFKKYYCDELADQELLRLNQMLPTHRNFSFDLPKEIKEKIWHDQRKIYGFEGDCRYEWEKFNDMDFAGQVKALGDLDISTWPQDNADVQKAQARIDLITPSGISRMAAALNGKDTRAIMEWGEAVIGQIEAYYTQEVTTQLDHYIAAEEQENLARACKDLTSLYVSALKKNRTRLIEEGAKSHTIKDRIAELNTSEMSCDNEIGHALAGGLLHEDIRARMREILDVTLPAYRAQMQTAYLQALGKQALSTEFTAEALGAVVMDKTRAREFADNMDALADKVRDLAGLQQAMSNNEILVLEHQKPLALDYKQVLALPAPDLRHHENGEPS